LAHIARTLPGVSAPSRVVRSIIRMAASSAHSLASRLIDLVARASALTCTPTWSTPGRPRSNWRSAASEATTSLVRCDRTADSTVVGRVPDCASTGRQATPPPRIASKPDPRMSFPDDLDHSPWQVRRLRSYFDGGLERLLGPVEPGRVIGSQLEQRLTRF